MRISELTLEQAAEQAAGNHLKWPFFWHYKPDNPEDWFILHLSYDPHVLDVSNAEVIISRLARISPEGANWRRESYGGAFGHGSGYSVRVYGTDRSITPEFACLYAAYMEIADYPVLDEDDYSRRESEGALQVWAECYDTKERIDYIRDHRTEFNFRDMADVAANVRGTTFGGYASELLA